MTGFTVSGASLVNEVNELAEARGEYQALRPLLPLSGERAPMRRRLTALIAQVSNHEWPGGGSSAQPDQPREPLSPAAVLLVAEMHATLSSYRDEASTAQQRHDRTVLRYEWVSNGAPEETASIRDFHGREIRARTRLPGQRDIAVRQYEGIVNEEIASAPEGMNFHVSLYQMNYASLLVRRATDEDFAIAEPLIRGGYLWRKERFGEKHPFTMVATGNLIAMILRRIEDPEGKRRFVKGGDLADIRAAIHTADALYRGRRAVLGDRSSTTALALLYLARLHLAAEDIPAAMNFAERSIAAMPDPPPSTGGTTLPMARVVLAECLVYVEGDERKSRRVGKQSARTDVVRPNAREMIDAARPVLAMSAISERWLSRIDNIALMAKPKAELMLPDRSKRAGTPNS